MQDLEQTLDSREVAEMLGKTHSGLLKDMRRYIQQFGEVKIDFTDFFRESTYKTGQNKELPCYLITRKGCEFIANKLTGTKGTAFTARYINRFHEMESIISSQSPAVAPVQPERMEQIEKEYADLKKEIKGIKSDLKRIGRSGGLQTVTYIGGRQYKDWIIRLLNVINESEDEIFLRRIYIIFRKHLERTNDFQWMA